MPEPTKLLVSGIPTVIIEWLRRTADQNERSVNRQIVYILKCAYRAEQERNGEIYQPLQPQTQSRENTREPKTSAD